MAVRLTNLLPSQVTALGVTLSVADQRWFIRFLWIALLYLTITFLLYAILDFWSWHANLEHHLFTYVKGNEETYTIGEAVKDADELLTRSQWWRLRKGNVSLKHLLKRYAAGEVSSVKLIWESSPIVATRLALDLVLPVIISLTAVVMLWAWPLEPRQSVAPRPAIERSVDTPASTQTNRR